MDTQVRLVKRGLMSKTIPLSKGLFAIVDDDKYDMVSQHKWYANKQGYPARRRKNNEPKGSYIILMHRFVLDTHNKDMNGLVTDHINRNKLDNRLDNLRIVGNGINTQASGQLSSNTTGYRGVSFNREKQTYEVYIRTGKRRIKAGYFRDIILAAKTYDFYARKLYGNLGHLNFPNEIISELPIEDKTLFRNNTSGYRGVSKKQNKTKWLAEFQVNKNKIRIGEFDDVTEAARAYDKVAYQYLGNKAKLNFPEDVILDVD